MKNLFLIVLYFLATFAHAQVEHSFKNPPMQYRPGVFWEWCNGNINKAGIRSDLEAMHRVGMQGGKVFNTSGPEGPVRFASQEWFEMMAFACEEAERLKMEIGLNITEGFNAAGGVWITPERSMQSITWNETEVVGPAKIEIQIKKPKPVHLHMNPSSKWFPPQHIKDLVLGFYEDVKVFAVPTVGDGRILDWKDKTGFPKKHHLDFEKVLKPTPPDSIEAGDIVELSKVVDISDKMDANGNLVWEAPEGNWTILRMGRMSTGSCTRPGHNSTTGLDVDKFSRENVKFHFDHMVQPLLDMKNVQAGHNIKFLGVDSWEAGHQNWSVVLPEEFEKRRGYSLYPWMPALTGRVIQTPELTERFLWDYRQTISDCIRENFFGYLTELSSELGMKFEAESFTRSTFDGMETAEVITSPCSTFWQRGSKSSFGKSWMSKWASSGAHVSGAKVVTAEAFPAAPANKMSAWVNHPWSMKQMADNHMCSGVNHFLFHCYPLQPWAANKHAVYKPGMIFKDWGTQYSQHNTWWEMSGDWHRYLSRCWYLLQQGQFAADVLYMTPEGTPGNEKGTARSVRLPAGFDWDLCSSKTVKEKLTFKDGDFCLPSGMRYKLLVLPEIENISLELLLKIRDLLAQGGHVMVRSRPQRAWGLTGYPESDKKVSKLVDELWQDLDGDSLTEKSFGKGKLYWGTGKSKWETEVVKKMELKPALSFQSFEAEKNFQYIHRFTEDKDIYFIAANGDSTPAANFSFRVSGKVPEFWYPDSGHIEKCVIYKEVNGRTEIPILFDTYGSVFVVFRDNQAEPASELLLDGQAVLSVNETLPAPDYSVFEKSGKLSLSSRSGKKIEEAFTAMTTLELNDNWTVSFPDDSDVEEPVIFQELTPWNEHPDDRIKYFSGTAVYSREFICEPKDQRVWLQLGQVEVISELFINGKKAQTLWKPPYRADVTDLIVPGKNKVEVHVANLWPNRMIGDERFPLDFEPRKRGLVWPVPQWLTDDIPRPEQRRKSFATCSYYKMTDPLLPSGLIGPVKVFFTPQFKNPKLQQVTDFVARHAVFAEE